VSARWWPRQLEDTGLSAHRLELEITETLLLGDTEAIMTELRTLKATGVSIVMDDFGTGYSSLSYLWRFPFDKIKIDRSFMQGFDGSWPRCRDRGENDHCTRTRIEDAGDR
jgi:EAL domain-containing protein (putative c-di-GMP-specific phosphodiesterase class I)